MTVDLSPKAVEALAREHDGIADAPYTPPTTALWHRETADTLRALSVELVRLRAERNAAEARGREQGLREAALAVSTSTASSIHVVKNITRPGRDVIEMLVAMATDATNAVAALRNPRPEEPRDDDR